MKIALGWRCTHLGALLAQPQKKWCPVSTESTFTCFCGKAFLGSLVAGWPGLDKGTLFYCSTCLEEPYTRFNKFVLQWWPEWYGCQFGRLRPYFTKPTRQLSGRVAESGLPSWHTEQISAQTWTTRAQSKVDQLSEMHGLIAFSESSE